MIAVNLAFSNSGPEAFCRIVWQPLSMQISKVTSAKINQDSLPDLKISLGPVF
jgi:hypothetical protein